MTAYAVALLKGVKDPEKFTRYRALAGDALAQHGGRISHMAQNPAKLEGSMEAPQTIVLLEFPTQDHAHAWHTDENLAEIHALRQNGADLSIFVVGEVG